MKKDDVIEEIQYMLSDLGLPEKWEVAKEVVRLAEAPPGTRKTIGSREGKNRRLTQAEAGKIVEQAKERILIADEGEPV